jgi:hypothetical protein
LNRTRFAASAKSAALSQAAAGETIGGGWRAFQEYEAGDLLPSRAIGGALMLIDHDVKAARVLEARRRKEQASARGDAGLWMVTFCIQ